MPRPVHPVSSYGPALVEMLRKGLFGENRITCKDAAQATHLVHRLHSLRLAMKRENHPDWEQYYRCGIHRDSKDKSVVIIRPRDSEFDYLAGVDSTERLPPPPKPTAITTATSTDADIEAFLAPLRNSVPKKD